MFIEYLSIQGVPQTNASKQDVINFLDYHTDVKGRGYRTVAKYRAALKVPLKKALRIKLDTSFNLSYMRGLRGESPPILSAPMPLWDVDTVMNFLCTGGFEPLDQADIYHVTLKTIILLIFSTGRRIGDIAHLTRRFFWKGKSRLFLTWPQSYGPKNFFNLEQDRARLGSYASSFPSIQMLDRKNPDNIPCPVWAYLHYLDRTSGPGFSKTYLWDHGLNKEKVNVQRLSRFLVACKRLNKSLCRSVRRSVTLMICPKKKIIK